MAPKKKTAPKKKVEVKKPKEVTVEQTIEEIEELKAQLVDQIAAKEAKLPRCGHINAHSLDLANKPDNLECDQPKGHPGNHSAPHMELNPEDIENPHEVTAYWSDAAGADWEEPVVPPLPVVAAPGWVATREPAKYAERK